MVRLWLRSRPTDPTEMKMRSVDSTSGVAIPYAEPKRYVADINALRSSKPDLSVLVLTGDPFQI